MFALIILSLILLIKSNNLDYIPQDAINYAKTYCKKYNPNYKEYELDEFEEANFISQCLFAGGQSFSGCKTRDEHGMVFKYNDLQDCLKSKGWVDSRTRDSRFKLGYPIFKAYDRYPLLAVGLRGNKILYAAHRVDECEHEINDEDLIFYYPKE